MASVVINGVSYQEVPYIKVPKVNNGGDANFYDTASATATASDLLAGAKAYNANGEITGSLTVPTISQDGTTKVLSIS
jgi:hypothetical protein